MHLRSRPLLRLLCDPLGWRPWGLDLDRDGINVLGGGRTFIGFDEIAAAPTVSAGFLSSFVTIPAESGAGVRVGSASKAAAQDFAIAARIAWQAFHRRKLEAKTGTVEHLLASLRVLEVPERYPSASSIQPILEQVRAFHEQVLKRLNLAALDPAEATQLRPIIRFATEPAQVHAVAIDRFIAAELARWEDFFDTVESKPLTPEQRLSVVVDEDATLVLAGAGSGKTSVITAKAAYLIKSGIRQPEELLLLAFARDAAKEMSERIRARCGVSVEARTFHALAYDIIGTVEGKKPALAAHASDDFAFLSLIQEILRDLGPVEIQGELMRAAAA